MQPRLPKKPNLDLFIHEDRVWQISDDSDEQPYAGPWPVVVLLETWDHHDGDGWRRSAVEARAEVLDAYEYNVSGGGSVTYAVLIEVKTERDLLALLKDGFGLMDTTPDCL